MQNSKELYTLTSASLQLEELYKNACCQVYLWDLLKAMYKNSQYGEVAVNLYGKKYFPTNVDEEDGLKEALQILCEKGYRVHRYVEESRLFLYWGPDMDRDFDVTKNETKITNANFFDEVTEF